jgi:putative oxidoreductase
MRDTTLLGLRLTLGSYLVAHGAQKLFGAFGGRGLEASAAGFDRIGLQPGRTMATVAATAELAGGLLTAAGLADPLGPVTLAATMAVASVIGHRGKGPFAARGGWELPLTNLAAAAVLGSTGPGRLSLDARLGVRLPRALARLTVAAGAAAAAALIARGTAAAAGA